MTPFETIIQYKKIELANVNISWGRVYVNRNPKKNGYQAIQPGGHSCAKAFPIL
jgi:hypothetical protein